jgi:lipoyl(octanoyl) transferase
MEHNKHIEIVDLGKMDYQAAWDFQENILQQQIAKKRENKSTENHLYFVEHPPVYTLGKSGNENNVLLNEKELESKGIQFYKTNRGGDITYHGPGQIVGYPIIDLENFKTDIGWYLRSLEEIIIKTLGEFKILGDRSKGETGVWLEPSIKGQERKICAMGVRCSRWVTMHGFALNVNTNLNHFDYMIPCGIQNKKVTSMQQELLKEIDIELVKQSIGKHFQQLFS